MSLLPGIHLMGMKLTFGTIKTTNQQAVLYAVYPPSDIFSRSFTPSSTERLPACGLVRPSSAQKHPKHKIVASDPVSKHETLLSEGATFARARNQRTHDET